MIGYLKQKNLYVSNVVRTGYHYEVNHRLTTKQPLLSKFHVKIYLVPMHRYYILALKAYQERLPVYCIGDLIKENGTFILKNPRQFILDNLEE